MKNLYYFVSDGGGEFRSIAPGASASNEKNRQQGCNVGHWPTISPPCEKTAIVTLPATRHY
jgi:hypothetical protein